MPDDETVRIRGEQLKCRESFAYWVNTYVQIKDMGEGSSDLPIPFHLWVAQEVVTRIICAARFSIALKARQLGITWLVAAYCLWLAINRFGQLVVIISAKEDLAVEFLDRVKFIFDHLPTWMKPSVLKRSTTELVFGVERKDARGQVVIGGLNSTIKSLPSTADAGQSKTISLLVMDESALNPHCKAIWGSAKPTLEHANGQAIIISNPSKTMPGWGWTRDLYVGAMRGENEFLRVFLPWWSVPGRGPDFLDEQRMAGLDDDAISMQYPSTEEEAISSLGGSYFSGVLDGWKARPGQTGRLVRLGDGEGRGLSFEPDPKGILTVWAPPEADKWANRYALGSDVSEGLGAAYSVGYVFDRVESRFVARLRSNKVAADIWADMLSDLGEWYGNAMLCPERNGAGITTINRLETISYPAMFYRKRPGKVKGEYVMEYGWLQTNENKQLLSDELKRYFRDGFAEVPCQILLDEASTYIRNDDGRLGHEEGKFDDCVIAGGLAIQASVQMAVPYRIGVEQRLPDHAQRLERLEQSAHTYDDAFERNLAAEAYDRDKWWDDEGIGMDRRGTVSDMDSMGR